MNHNTCCFTGHRLLPHDKIESIMNRLNEEIDNLYRQGVTDYISGGELGFDQIAASLIIALKERGYNMHLTFALPCKNQSERWMPEQQRHYQKLLKEADKIIYVSEQFTPDCMKKRNFYMVDNSAFCICGLISEKSGTGQTVRYARKKGLRIINVAF